MSLSLVNINFDELYGIATYLFCLDANRPQEQFLVSNTSVLFLTHSYELPKVFD